MKIHPEGYTIIGFSLLLIGALNLILLYFNTPGLIFYPILVLSLLLLILIVQFFRFPSRDLTISDKYIVAPADGKVVVIEEVFENEFLQKPCRQISIFMSPLNVHINWYPVSGKVTHVRYHKGKYLVAWHPKASSENERTSIVIEKENRHQILVRQIAGALARRIVYYPHENDMVRQGAQFGFIKFGSRVDVFIPLDCKVKVQLGQKTTGGVSILAEA